MAERSTISTASNDFSSSLTPRGGVMIVLGLTVDVADWVAFDVLKALTAIYPKNVA